MENGNNIIQSINGKILNPKGN